MSILHTPGRWPSNRNLPTGAILPSIAAASAPAPTPAPAFARAPQLRSLRSRCGGTARRERDHFDPPYCEFQSMSRARASPRSKRSEGAHAIGADGFGERRRDHRRERERLARLPPRDVPARDNAALTFRTATSPAAECFRSRAAAERSRTTRTAVLPIPARLPRHFVSARASKPVCADLGYPWAAPGGPLSAGSCATPAGVGRTPCPERRCALSPPPPASRDLLPAGTTRAASPRPAGAPIGRCRSSRIQRHGLFPRTTGWPKAVARSSEAASSWWWIGNAHAARAYGAELTGDASSPPTIRPSAPSIANDISPEPHLHGSPRLARAALPGARRLARS